MTISGSPVGGAASAFEDIVTRYSKLALSKPKDRPYAIAGLQSRLEKLYNTESTHGIVHCCFLKSLLWQRAEIDRMKEIDDAKFKTIPSWSWMKYQGEIRYGKIPVGNISWNRDIKLAKPDSTNQEQHVLEAPVVRILHGYSVELWQHTDCKIKDSKGRPLGWIRFDNNDETDIGNLGCVIIAQEKPIGWIELGPDGWKQFAYLAGDKSLHLSKVSYVLMVSNAAYEQGYKVKVSRRLGVAAIQSVYLSSSTPPQTVWVI
jgi:hypothetical protein